MTDSKTQHAVSLVNRKWSANLEGLNPKSVKAFRYEVPSSHPSRIHKELFIPQLKLGVNLLVHEKKASLNYLSEITQPTPMEYALVKPVQLPFSTYQSLAALKKMDMTLRNNITEMKSRLLFIGEKLIPTPHELLQENLIPENQRKHFGGTRPNVDTSKWIKVYFPELLPQNLNINHLVACMDCGCFEFGSQSVTELPDSWELENGSSFRSIDILLTEALSQLNVRISRLKKQFSNFRDEFLPIAELMIGETPIWSEDVIFDLADDLSQSLLTSLPHMDIK